MRVLVCFLLVLVITSTTAPRTTEAQTEPSTQASPDETMPPPPPAPPDAPTAPVAPQAAPAAPSSPADSSPTETQPATPAAPTAYDPLAPQQLGPIRVSPRPANIALTERVRRTGVSLRMRFLVENTSSGDVQLQVQARSLAATDEAGRDLMSFPPYNWERHFTIAGLPACLAEDAKMCMNDPDGYATLSPGQRVELAIIRAPFEIDDPHGEFRNTYRPQTISTSGSLLVRDLAKQSAVRRFSFVDLPLMMD